MTNPELLARFPGPLRLYPPRWSYLVGVPIGLFFMAISMTYEQRGPFWGGMLLSGFAIAASVLSVSALANSLTLRDDGFTVRFSFRRMAVPWSVAHNFASVHLYGQAQVVFQNDSLSGTGSDETGGRNAVLGRTYGMPAEQLAELMSLWRKRAMAAHAVAPS